MGLKSRKFRPAAALFAALAVLMGGVFAGCGSSDSSSDSGGSAAAGGEGESYEVYVSLNFSGNSYRQQIVKTMELAQEKGELAGRVDVNISSAGQTVQAQAQDIDNITRRKPDILVILPSSSTGLSAAIERACAAGVTVVAFDSHVETPCVYNVGVDFFENAKRLGAWLGEQAGDKGGTMLVDQGIPGIPAVEEMFDGYSAGIEESNPAVTIKEFQSQLAPGPEKAALAALLPAYKDSLAGIASVSYGTSVMDAVREAGIPPTPLVTLTGNNGDLGACLENKKEQRCFFGATPATQGADAMKLGVEVRDGDADSEEKEVLLPTAWYSNTGAGIEAYPEVKPEAMKVGVNTFPDLPPTFAQPYSTDWLPITPEELVGG